MNEETGRLPSAERCLEFVRECRFGESVSCPHCGGTDVTRKGTTGKGARRYRCGGCDSYFNDLTGTVFAGHQLAIEEMVYIITLMDRRSVADISRDLDRTYKTVLEFVHKGLDREGRDTIVTEIRNEPGPFLQAASSG